MADFYVYPWVLGGYLALAIGLSSWLRALWAQSLFTLLNIGAVFVMFFYRPEVPSKMWHAATYLGIVLVQYVIFRATWRSNSRWAAACLFSPLAFLVALRLLPLPMLGDYSVWFGSWIVPIIAQSGLHDPLAFPGLSYVSFRLSLMAMEVRSGGVAAPSILQYLSFVSFVPALVIGPITPYRNFVERWEKTVHVSAQVAARAFFRVFIGLIKFFFLSGLFYQLTFTRSFMPGGDLSVAQFLVSLTAYPIYLYLNFSGFCDVMIGVSALMGFSSKENFDSPLSATNLQAFWSRWHISLTEYLRALIFSPLMRWVGRRWGAGALNHAAPIGMALVFLAMGIWHGFALNYLAFAALHAVGLSIYHYWRLWGRGRFTARGRELAMVLSGASWLLTFSFVAIAFFFFENDLSRVEQVMTALNLMVLK